MIRLLVRNSKQAGVDAYFLIEEYNVVIRKVRELKKEQDTVNFAVPDNGIILSLHGY